MKASPRHQPESALTKHTITKYSDTAWNALLRQARGSEASGRARVEGDVVKLNDYKAAALIEGMDNSQKAAMIRGLKQRIKRILCCKRVYEQALRLYRDNLKVCQKRQKITHKIRAAVALGATSGSLKAYKCIRALEREITGQPSAVPGSEAVAEAVKKIWNDCTTDLHLTPLRNGHMARATFGAPCMRGRSPQTSTRSRLCCSTCSSYRMARIGAEGQNYCQSCLRIRSVMVITGKDSQENVQANFTQALEQLGDIAKNSLRYFAPQVCSTLNLPGPGQPHPSV